MLFLLLKQSTNIKWQYRIYLITDPFHGRTLMSIFRISGIAIENNRSFGERKVIIFPKEDYETDHWFSTTSYEKFLLKGSNKC
jgi:hypothetical protein